MENASKALLIAAAVLVVIIIIAVGMKIYSSTTDAQKVGINTGKAISDKTGEATDLAIEEITGKKQNKNIKYYENLGQSDEKEITVQEAGSGNSIKIGDEQFMIFYKGIETDETSPYKNKEIIKAIPYYNLVIETSTGKVKQGPAVSGISTEIASTFSTTNYWNQEDIEIDMSDSKNNIQQYITAYKTTLDRLGTEGVLLRTIKYSELIANGVTSKMNNPSQTGRFWSGSNFRQGTINESVRTIEQVHFLF